MFKFNLFVVLLSVNLSTAIAGYESGRKAFDSRAGSLKIADTLIRNGYPFASIPYIKINMVNGRQGRGINQIIERAIEKVGIKQFEALSTTVLEQYSSPGIRFILAKKLFRQQKYRRVISELRKVRSGHPLRPYALLLQGSTFGMLKEHEDALEVYESCQGVASSMLSNPKNDRHRFQLQNTLDYCVLGRARTLFAMKKYKTAELAYLDLPKKSYIWPEILFEEAWNSYYLGVYNRTLGKLVTYKSPFLQHIYNPEVDVLRALTYLKLCLWRDTKKESDIFYQTYLKDAQKLRAILKRRGINYRFYFNSALTRTNKRLAYGELYNKVLFSITKEAAYLELMESFKSGMKEYKQVRRKPASSFKNRMMRNLAETLKFQRDITGAYVRKRLLAKYAELFKAFQQMSYIKLEMLSQKKRRLYEQADNGKRQRGDIQYLPRNEKQYFWDFNGEFWADELGDYVFALRSEC